MLPPDSDEPAQLETMLLLAEARQFLSEPAEGLAFIHSVRGEVDAVLDSLTLDTVETVTLTSESGGGIPVRVTNGAQETLSVSVRLASQHLRETLSADLVLAPGASETVRFQAQLRRRGGSREVQLCRRPAGRSTGRRPVRSTSTTIAT
jgi:hypothetical protein